MGVKSKSDMSIVIDSVILWVSYNDFESFIATVKAAL